ncbi:MAG TPA: endonuclease MutS2 [bacterium]|nr:endonuclease MutS2 [bacterium]
MPDQQNSRSPDTADIVSRSLAAIGWPEILDALAARAASEPGKRECRDPFLADTAAAADLALVETDDMALLFDLGDPPAPAPISDVIPLVEKARAGGALDPMDLVKITDTLAFAADAVAYFAAHPQAARLGEWAARLDEQAQLRRVLQKSIDRDGSILDSASPELDSLRSRHRVLKERIHKRLSEIVARNPDTVLQDNFYTQRGQRYVVPVKASAQSQFDGIVHDASGSGLTVFIEPAEMVEPNNRLKLIEAGIEAEVMRILRDLSGRVGENADAVITDQRVLSHLDVVRARARLAMDLKAGRPEVNDRGRIRLRAVRHPLLVLRGLAVVPNDIDLGDGFSVLLVSGPNAGGKTVGLASLGLLAMMARAGMFIPAAPGSEMAVFKNVYAVIGDEQDLSRDLSSFSAHIMDIAAILAAAGPASLVLLDELMSSTDPEEGAALASALLSALSGRGALIAATTHLPALKSYAHGRKGFMNASYTFDQQTLSPTYRLMIGVPGRSLGIEMAARLAMPPELIREARAEMGQASVRMESLIADLAQKSVRLDAEFDALHTARAEAEESAAAYAELKDRAETREKEIKRNVKTAVREAVKKAEAEVAGVMAPVKNKGLIGRDAAEEARQKLRAIRERAEEENQVAGEDGAAPDWKKIDIGDKVKILPLGVEAEVVARPGPDVRPDTEVKVRIGKLQISVPAARIRALHRAKPRETSILKPAPQKKPLLRKKEPRVTVPETPAPAGPGGLLPQTSQNTLDLRGQRVYEAEGEVEKFLDDACRKHLPNVYIIHGHGTGALKQLVREILALSPYVESFRPGERTEGGDGVSMAVLKEWG